MVDKPLLELVTVGTGSCVPRLERGSNCVLVRAAGLVVAVDLGLGSLHGLLRCGVSHNDVDAVVLTHFHPDHSCELLPFLFAANYDERPRTKPLTLIGGVGLEAFLDKLIGVYGHWIQPGTYKRSTVELSAGEGMWLGALSVTGGEVFHSPSSIALRFEYGGKSAVLTGDTGPSKELETFARGADLIICEAALPEGTGYESSSEPDAAPYHLNARQAGELAQRAGVGKLALTHFYPASDFGADYDPVKAASEAFNGPVVAALDAMKFTL